DGADVLALVTDAAGRRGGGEGGRGRGVGDILVARRQREDAVAALAAVVDDLHRHELVRAVAGALDHEPGAGHRGGDAGDGLEGVDRGGDRGQVGAGGETELACPDGAGQLEGE